MKLAHFPLFIAFLTLLGACKREDEHLYKKIVSEQALFDSLQTQNYQTVLDIGQSLLGLTQRFAVEFADSKYSEPVKKIAEQVFLKHRNLQQEYNQYRFLRENVLNANNGGQVIDSLLQQVRSFGVLYPNSRATMELGDMRNLLQFQRSINIELNTKFDNLGKLNAVIGKSKSALQTIQDTIYRQPIHVIIQLLEEQRIPLCEEEADRKLAEMKNEMQKYANSELLKDSWAAKLGSSLLGKHFMPTIKNEQISYENNNIIVDRDYVYELRVFLAQRQFIIPVRGVVHKNCEAIVSYEIVAEKAEHLQVK